MFFECQRANLLLQCRLHEHPRVHICRDRPDAQELGRFVIRMPIWRINKVLKAEHWKCCHHFIFFKIMREFVGQSQRAQNNRFRPSGIGAVAASRFKTKWACKTRFSASQRSFSKRSTYGASLITLSSPDARAYAFANLFSRTRRARSARICFSLVYKRTKFFSIVSFFPDKQSLCPFEKRESRCC